MLLVMVYHAGVGFPRAGFSGVDVFFVVSGFVITAQLVRELERDNRLSVLKFYGRRAKRLLPAATLVIIVTGLASWLLAPTAQWRSIGSDLIASSVYLVNWLFADRAVDYLAEDVDPSPMLHYWSLAVEEQFYIVWPLIMISLIWVSRRLRGAAVPSRSLLAMGLTVLVIIPSLIVAFALTSSDPERAFFVTPTRLWELGLGALVALGARSWSRLPPAIAASLAWGGVLTVLLGAFLQDHSTPWPAPGALVPTLGTAAVIVGGFAAGGRGPVALLGLRPLVWIGGLSYSLYLWHWTLLVIASWRFGELGPGAGLAVVALSVVPAWLSFRLVERPIRFAPALNANPGTAVSAGLNMSLAGGVTGLLLTIAALTAAGGVAGGQQVGDPRDSEQDVSSTATPPTPPTTVTAPPGEEAHQKPPVYDVLTPNPLQATDDLPDHYARGCQIPAADSTPVRCESGDPDSDTTVAVVGDSKVLQWISAIEHISEEEGWHVVSYTKSGCSASSATVYDDDGQLYEECMAWSQAVLDELRMDPPDIYITSGRREIAGPEWETATPEAMTQGYVDFWKEVDDLGARVIALSDSPGPRLESGRPPYECVSDHPESAVEDCSWPYKQSRSSQALMDAVEEVPDAAFIDMDPWICPAGTCPSVFRNIVTYRQGSHLTMTYVLFLTPDLAAQLVPLVNEATE